jgi:tyrosine-specific transport protein
MHSKLIGSILLIVGSSIGAGMLALPIATAQLGFVGSLVLLFACWFVMTVGAFYILEANLWLPQNSNIISMAKATIGPVGQLIAWANYLLLLYSLLCAYVAGGSDLLHNLLTAAGFALSPHVTVIFFTLLLGAVVCLGIRAVDYVNRGFMAVKLGAYVLVVALLMPFISLDKLGAGEIKHITSAMAVMVTITSFGFSAIVPSLRIYFAGDNRGLKIAIVVGSLIPLVCYIFWDMVIMGFLPLGGEHGLVTILQSQGGASDLVNALDAKASRGAITFFVKLFTSISVVTSFLGVSLCLSDFLADGLQREKKGSSAYLIYALTFLPPAVIVLFFPNIFVKALEYAGIYCVILLMLLPAWIVWAGRYKRKIAKGFTVPGGKPLIIATLLVSLALLVQFVVA